MFGRSLSFDVCRCLRILYIYCVHLYTFLWRYLAVFGKNRRLYTTAAKTDIQFGFCSFDGREQVFVTARFSRVGMSTCILARYIVVNYFGTRSRRMKHRDEHTIVYRTSYIRRVNNRYSQTISGFVISQTCTHVIIYRRMLMIIIVILIIILLYRLVGHRRKNRIGIEYT